MGDTEDSSPEILWDEAQAVRIDAHAAYVSYTQEEVALRFGDSRRSNAPYELVFESYAQILLSPVLAKRLALRLEGHMRDYERRYGPLEHRPRPGSVRPSPGTAGRTPSMLKLDGLPEAALSLAGRVRDLGVTCGLERSFKFMKGTLLTRRLLLGFRRDALPPDGTSRLAVLCRRIGMPEDHLTAFQERLPGATIVLFGFEQEGDKSTFRAYLELGDRFRNPGLPPADPLEPFTIHLGYKWDPEDETRKTTTQYTCFPGLAGESMIERIRGVYGDRDSANPLAITEAILACARGKGPEDAFLYFEAKEEGNPRRSFDLNLYAANLRMRELLPFLSDICLHYDIHRSAFSPHYEAVQDLVFGHLTGGVDRSGRDFMTVYFGEKGSTI